MTTISCNFINNLSKNLKDSLKCANRFQRTKKISETEIFSIMCYQIQDNSYTDTVNYFLENTGKHITEASIVYRRKQISTDILTNVYNNLYNKYKYLFKDCKSKFSLQMVDGSNISLLPSFEKFDFPKMPSGILRHGLITGIYDYDNDIIQSLSLDNVYDERDMFMKSMKYLNLNSKKNVFVFDRGYWRPKVAFYLKNNNHDFVFRMNKINNKLKPLLEGKTTDFIGTYEIKLENGEVISNKVRYIRYDIEKSCFLIATSLLSTPIEEIKTMYHKRWSIEVVYKLFKNVCDIELTKHKIPEFYKQNIELFRIIYLIQKILYDAANVKYDLCKYKKKNYNNTMKVLINYIIGKLVHTPNNYCKQIKKLISSIFKNYVVSKPGRHFRRESLSMSKKWYVKGRVYGRNRKTGENT